MEKWVTGLTSWYNSYFESFNGLTNEQKINFHIKRDHSFRVAELSVQLAEKLKLESEEQKVAYFIGLFHDIGRFRQLVEYNTFNDEKSVDHAKYSVQILNEMNIFKEFELENKEGVLTAIRFHNKLKLPDELPETEMIFAKLIRDADKLDILKVLIDYYSSRNAPVNHTLTWELSKGSTVSSAVAKEVLAGKQVSKKNVVSEIDVKVMQMSWVYDLNFRPAFEYLQKNRFLERIYKTLPKNDLVIDIHRKVKVFSENKILT